MAPDYLNLRLRAASDFITLFLSFIFSYQFHMSYFHFHKNHPASSQYRSPQTNYQDWRQIHWSRYNQVSYHRSAEKAQQGQVRGREREREPVQAQAHKLAWTRKV